MMKVFIPSTNLGYWVCTCYNSLIWHASHAVCQRHAQ